MPVMMLSGCVESLGEGCKDAEDVSVRGVLSFPLNPRAIVTLVFAEENWNKALIEADESLICVIR